MKMRPAAEAVRVGNVPSRTFERAWEELCCFMDDDVKVKSSYDGNYFNVPLYIEFDTNELIILKKKLKDSGYILDRMESRELQPNDEYRVCNTFIFSSAVKSI